MTNDTREVIRNIKRDDSGNYYLDNKIEPEITDKKSKKVEFLTDYVMVGHGGIVVVTDFILNYMRETVKNNYDLSQCKTALEQALQEIENGNCPDDVKDFFKTENLVGVILNGFYKDGRIGQVTWSTGKEVNEVALPIDNTTSFFASSIDPTVDLAEKKLLPKAIYGHEPDERDVNTFVNSMAWVHAIVSKLHPDLVSTDMQYYVLIRDGNKIVRTNGEFDTIAMHSDIPD